MRTVSTRTTGISQKWGTSSGLNPEEDFEQPEDLSDIVGLDAEIPRGSARPSGGLLEPKAKPRTGIGLEVGKSAGGGLGIGVSIPIGGPISARGGVNIGAGGAIKGAQVGVGVGVGPIGASVDVGTDQDESGRGGCYQYVTVTLGPFSHTYGKNVCEPKPPTEPTQSETPTPTPTAAPDFKSCGAFNWQLCTIALLSGSFSGLGNYRFNAGATVTNNYGAGFETNWLEQSRILMNGFVGENNYVIKTKKESRVFTYRTSNFTADYGNTIYPYPASGFQQINPNRFIEYTVEERLTKHEVVTLGDRVQEVIIYPSDFTNTNYTGCYEYNGYGDVLVRKETTLLSVAFPPCPTPTPTPTPTPLPTLLPPPLAVPNPPPKKMDNDCCKKSLLLQAEILRLLGRELGKDGLVPQTKKVGFIGEEFERVETPIKDPTNPKKIKVRFTTVYELLMYALKQSNNLDTALDPQSYKLPTGKVQNPLYNRDSEHSLKSNNQPERDKSGNKRELEINKDDEAKMTGFLQQQSYMFQMLRRFEYLFPPGELEDALIAKSLLIPGAKGDIKIHNMIMAFELQMQYLDATLGNPREAITIKDANPAIAGDQPIEIKTLSISDLLRQNLKFQIDTAGDVDALVNLALRIFRTNLAQYIAEVKTGEMVQALFEDSGMIEKQEYIELHLEGDPYAGQWVKGQGFKPNPKLEMKTEEATEEVLRETMKPQELKVKVSRRSKDEKTDMRDLIRGLADFVQRLLSIPTAGNPAEAIDKLVESAKFKVQTEAALLRQNITQAAAATRNRTKKRKK